MFAPEICEADGLHSTTSARGVLGAERWLLTERQVAHCREAEESLLYSIYSLYWRFSGSFHDNEFWPEACCLVMHAMLHSKTKGILPQPPRAGGCSREPASKFMLIEFMIVQP